MGEPIREMGKLVQHGTWHENETEQIVGLYRGWLITAELRAVPAARRPTEAGGWAWQSDCQTPLFRLRPISILHDEEYRIFSLEFAVGDPVKLLATGREGQVLAVFQHRIWVRWHDGTDGAYDNIELMPEIER